MVFDTNILVSGVKAGARILLKNGTVKYCTVPKRVKPLLDEAAGNQDVAEPTKYQEKGYTYYVRTVKKRGI